MKISEKFAVEFARYSYRHNGLPKYLIFQTAGLRGSPSRITRLLHYGGLGESDQVMAIKLGEFLGLKPEEVFKK